MRHLLVIALLALALPAAAQEDVQIVEISHNSLESSTRPVLHHTVASRSGNVDDIATAINGYFLWVQYGDGETVSVDVSDVTIRKAVVSLDGTVTLIREAPEPTVEAPEPTQPVEEEIDLVVKYPDVPLGVRVE